MKTNDIEISAYFSHPIRGLKGASATVEDMSLNNDLAALVAQMLGKACPALKLYVPAENDEYIVEAYERGSASEHEILEIDKIILLRRDILIAFTYNDVISNGMRIEIDCARQAGIPIFQFSEIREIPELVQGIIEWYYERRSSLCE